MKKFLRYSMIVVVFLMTAVNANAGWDFESVTPAAGTVEKIGKITLVPSIGSVNEFSVSYQLSKPDGSTQNVAFSVSFNDFRTFTSGDLNLTAPGTYTLTVPAGSLNEFGTGNPNNATTFTWTIAGSSTPDPEPDPEPEATKYSLNISSSIANGTVSISGNLTQAKAGDVITLNASANPGYQFDSWNVTANGEPVTVTNNTFTMPAADVTISANFVESNTSYSFEYTGNQIRVVWPEGTNLTPTYSGQLQIEGYDGYINGGIANSKDEWFTNNDMIRVWITLPDGNYTFVIPEGHFTIDGVENSLIRIPFTVGDPSAPIDIEISDALYATFVPSADVDITSNSDVEAYIVTSVNDGYIKLAQTALVPANNAVVVKANAAGTYHVERMSGAKLSGANLLKVSNEKYVNIENRFYILAKGNKGVGFYPVKLNSNIPKNKGYLEITNTSAAKPMYGFSFDDVVTNVQGVVFEKLDGSCEVYDLQGCRLQQMQKGINIVNGKKVLVK